MSKRWVRVEEVVEDHSVEAVAEAENAVDHHHPVEAVAEADMHAPRSTKRLRKSQAVS